MFRQRNKHKDRKKKGPNGEGKRSIEKMKKDVEKLNELIGLVSSDNINSINVSQANANSMGGRNSRQPSIRRESDDISHITDNSSDTIQSRISQLKRDLNILSLTISVKKRTTFRDKRLE